MSEQIHEGASGAAEPARAGGRRLRLVVAGVVGAAIGAVLVAVLVSGASNAAPAAGSFTLTGSLTVPGVQPIAALQSSQACLSGNGYDDITPGSVVTVYDAAGQVVATGSLGSPSMSGYTHCVFPVSVPAVPGGAKSLQVEIGHRGRLTVTGDQARAGAFAATLGS